MSSERWWRFPTEHRRLRFSLFDRGKPKPYKPLLYGTGLDTPIAVELESLSFPAPREVAWLFRLEADNPAAAVNVNVQPLPDRTSDQRGDDRISDEREDELDPDRSRGIAAPAGQTSPSRRPTIAARLRSALIVPLDLLLPGERSVLEWPTALMPYQEDGVRALLEQPRLLLADDMGLGKTVQVIATIRILCHQRAIAGTLLIVPASLIDQWRREFARWAPELRVIPIRGPSQDRAWLWGASAHVTMVSYETFRSDFLGSSPSGSVRRIWDLVVLDEAQKIKNRESDTSRQVKKLKRRRSWAMTGTPLENKIDDLASILEFVDHADDGSRRTYAPNNALLERHKELQLRRKKSDVINDLPPKQIINVIIPLLSKQREAYMRAEQDGIVQLRAHGASIRIEHILELITRLKQLCNRDPVSGESAKFEDMHERLRVLADEGHRALLFSQYTDQQFGVGAAANYFQAFNPLKYTGALSSAERDSIIQRFKSDITHRALILSLRAGGVGLNLQDASYVFHIDRWWNPAVERQAEDRTHRLGQVYPVTVIKYTCLDTIEERIDQILSEKQQLFDEIVDDVSLDVATRLTRDELFKVVKLDPPPRATTSSPSRRTGLELEERCVAILEGRGWHVRRLPAPRDGKIDLIATKTDEVGLDQTICVQCKNWTHRLGVEAIRELLGALPTGLSTRPVVAAPFGLTEDAQRLADLQHVVVWDAAVLRRLDENLER